MLVKELIETLKEYPAHCEVVIEIKFEQYDVERVRFAALTDIRTMRPKCKAVMYTTANNPTLTLLPGPL